MCLIITKPKHVKLSSRIFDYIKKGVQFNSDLAGVALKRHNQTKITVNRGLSTAAEICDLIDDMHVNKNDQLMIHLRFATQGSVCVENTHPFIITGQNRIEDSVSKAELQDGFVMSHNGQFGRYGRSNNEGESDYSDTRLFAKYFLARKSTVSGTEKLNVEHLFDFREKKSTQKSFSDAIENGLIDFRGQKVAILSAKSGLLHIGNFYKCSHGYIHSNTSVVKTANKFE